MKFRTSIMTAALIATSFFASAASAQNQTQQRHNTNTQYIARPEASSGGGGGSSELSPFQQEAEPMPKDNSKQNPSPTTKQTKNPYWNPKDWSYIMQNSGG
jgi:hypothetical protein